MVDIEELREMWNKGTGLLFSGENEGFWEYVSQLREVGGERGVLSYLLEEYYYRVKEDSVKAMKIARRVISSTSNPYFLTMAWSHMSWALRVTGDISGARSAVLKHLEFASETGKRDEALILLAYTNFFAEDLAEAENTLSHLEGLSGLPLIKALHVQALLELFKGNFAKAEELAREIIKHKNEDYAQPFKLSLALEVLGCAREAMGDVDGALAIYASAFEQEIAGETAYALFYLNKVERIRLIAGARKPINADLAKRAILLAQKTPEGRAGLTEYCSLSFWETGRFSRVISGLIEAGDAYIGVNQPQEALIVYLIAAMLAKKHDAPGFWTAIERIRPKFGLYRAFLENHFFFRDFTGDVLVPLFETSRQKGSGIKISMLGGMNLPGMKAPEKWRSKKALLLFKYLLLNEGRPLQADYLVWLLWPRANPKKGMDRLYPLVSAIRKELGKLSGLLVSKGGCYSLKQSQELWVDVHEFRRLMREAESLEANPCLQLEKCLEAIELYRGDLLPEDRYDRFIEEHRSELRHRFRWAVERATQIFLSSGRKQEALELAQKLYLAFPKDNAIASAYINVLVSSGKTESAREVYKEFKNRLWREHRMKPSFGFSDNRG